MRVYIRAFKANICKYLNFTERFHVKWNRESEREGGSVCFMRSLCLCHALLFLGLKSSALIKAINALIKILLNNIKENNSDLYTCSLVRRASIKAI